MADERLRSLAVMQQLSRLRDAEIDGHRATVSEAAEKLADTTGRVHRLSEEIAALDARVRNVSRPGGELHAGAMLGHARYRAATAQSRERVQQIADEQQAELERQQSTLKRLLAERNALNARHDRLARSVETDLQRAEGRELDGLVAARSVAREQTSC